MSNYTAIFDACVLYPAPLRDLLMSVALADIFRAKWSHDIHEEWMKSLLQDRPDLARGDLERTKELMNLHVRDCVVTGYESLIPSLELPDPADRHVLAAAIVSRADVIVTFNLRDFPEKILLPYGIETQHPDDFLLYQFDLEPHKFCSAARHHRARLKNPPKTVDEYLQCLERQGLPLTVSRLFANRDAL